MIFCSDIVVRAPKHPQSARKLCTKKNSSPWEAPKLQLCWRKIAAGTQKSPKNAVLAQKVASGSVSRSVLQRFCVPLPFRIDFVHGKIWFSHDFCTVFFFAKTANEETPVLFWCRQRTLKNIIFPREKHHFSWRKTMIFKKSRLFVLHDFGRSRLKNTW